MKVAYLQTNPKFLKVAENLRRVEANLARVSADLIVLPELFSSGYNFESKKQVAAVAESVFDGPSVEFLRNMARKKNAAIVAGLAEKHQGKFYNSAVFVTPKKTEVYRKVHLFGREKLFFTPGNRGFRVFEWKGVKIGVMVCFDWFFPEACRTLALKGAQVIAHPSNLVLPWCPETMKSRSLENRVYSITCNRAGRENNLTYIGQSQIVDPWGKVLKRAPKAGESSAVVTIDPKLARSKELNRFNDLFRDRRPSTYL